GLASALASAAVACRFSMDRIISIDFSQSRADTGGMRARANSLWRHRDFMKLWTGETVSKLGSQVSLLAIPLIAITVLKASTFEVGLLSAVEFAPFILVALHAGVWVDRLTKRPVLIVADVGRFVALLSIPLAYELDVL